MNRTAIFPVLMLVLAMLGCSLPAGATPTAAPPLPKLPGPTPTVFTLPTPALTIPAVPPLTLDRLRNGRYFAPFYARTVPLTNGSYTEGSGTTFYSVQMLNVYALGDLNGDGVADAALLLVENGGGSGQFESLVVVINQDGSAHQVDQVELGDRFMINSVTITAGKVALNMLVDGPNDPMCCPSQAEVQTYRLYAGKLWLSCQTSQTPAGGERAVSLSAPADLSAVNSPFTISGSVTLAPFENTLTYRIYLPDGTTLDMDSVVLTIH